jgi:hypothetical protein
LIARENRTDDDHGVALLHATLLHR